MTSFDYRYVSEIETHRLLSNAYIDEPAIAPLYDEEGEKAVLDALEARSSNRLLGQNGQLDELDERELATESFGYGWSFVNAAFTYTRSGGSRFNQEDRGAWYAALRVATCLEEVKFHLGRELKNTNETHNLTQYIQLLAHLQGPMACLLNHAGTPCLDADIARGYPAGQKFAQEVRQADLVGIRYPSVRHSGGICLAALKPSCIKKVARGASFLLEWSGNPEPAITRLQRRRPRSVASG